MDNLLMLLQMLKHTFSVIAICETWETATNTNLLQIMGYIMVSHAIKLGRVRSCSVGNSINFTPRPDLEDTGLNLFE